MSMYSLTDMLASTDKLLPEIGLGTFLMPEDESVVENALRSAIDVGYTHIDSAFSHPAEKFVGRALKKIMDEKKIKREQLFITTKLPSNGMQSGKPEYFLRKSLESLQLEYVDLYLIQSPMATKAADNDDEIVQLVSADGGKKRALMENVDLVELWHEMEALVDKKLTKAIGVSNFNSEQIERICAVAKCKPSNLQVECHPYLPQYELQKTCKKHKITMTAYAPLGSPSFPEYTRTNMHLQDYLKDAPRLLDDETLKSVAEKRRSTPAQILLAYLRKRGIAVIPKSIDPARIVSNFESRSVSLDEKDVKVLGEMENGRRYFGLDYWEGFKQHAEFPFHDATVAAK